MDTDNKQHAAIAPPNDVAQVEQLVKRLYQPGQPALISQIDDQLKQLQLSQHGWKLADELMGSSDAGVRFYAALTFMVKLNNDGASLDVETAQTVQMRLIHWVVCLVGQGESKMVSKKLCSTLTTYFVRSPVPWDTPILHIARSFQQETAVPESELRMPKVTMPDCLSSLKAAQVLNLLWFAGDLASQLSRTDAGTPTGARLHDQMESIVKDASTLMSWSLKQPDLATTPEVREAALQTFGSWINYAQPVWPRKPEILQYLRDLIQPAAECVLDDRLLVEMIGVFRDNLENYTSFFEPSHMQMLARLIHDYIRPEIQRALASQDSSDLLSQLSTQFVTAFGTANVQQVVERPDDQYGSQEIVKILSAILAAPGYPGDNDSLSLYTIEFWNTYVEYVVDGTFSNDQGGSEPAWFSKARNILQQSVEPFWRKMWTPPNEVAKDWGDDEREDFKQFRQDTADLMLSMFVVLGRPMLEQLVGLALKSLAAAQWHGVEAALLCLSNLSDNALEAASNEVPLREIFRSNLFRQIADFTQEIPLQVRRTAMDLLGAYGSYIERHAEFLPDTVRFLFASLEVTGLATSAARSIGNLCSACRSSLTGELDGFLEQYRRFAHSSTSDPYTKEKVMGAIAAIIQAQTPESAKVRPLLMLLEFVETDIEATRKYATSGDSEIAETTGVSALECLASIGKGLQVPADLPINIYDDDETPVQLSNFWASEEGQAVQQRIIGCFSVLQYVGDCSAAIDAACQVLRSGFPETAPGPFVLPPLVTVNFLQQCSVTTPQVEAVLSTASTLIAQHSRHSAPHIDAEVGAIFASVAGLAHAIGNSATDPTVASACIEVLNKMTLRYTHILLSGPTSSVLDFTLTAVAGPDPLPKRAACDFWTKLIKLQTSAMPEHVQQRMEQVITAIGPKLSDHLVAQIGGLALRSDLDALCEPLKALLLHRKEVQIWLQSGLTSVSFPNQNVPMEQRAMLLRQLIATRSDGRKAKELVKAFWAACRGTVVSYSS